MPSNLDRYKKDLENLLYRGGRLLLAIYIECYPDQYKSIAKKEKDAGKPIPSFKNTYQSWYSEAKILVKQLLPDRLADFASHYERPRNRKDITYASYRIEDYLQGLAVNNVRGSIKEKIVGPEAAIPQFEQQLAIAAAVKARFESSLFDIRQLVQADLFDSEIDAAEELARNKFTRASGAVAGVVLEKHLGQVCNNHNLSIAKKNPTISDFNDALKNAKVIDPPQWRFVQHLADIRNLCDHNKQIEPTKDQVTDLLAGVKKITKTLF